MENKTRTFSVIFCLFALLLLIIDTQTASNGAIAGIELCMKVLIPSLFPFFLTIHYANSLIAGQTFPGLRSLGRILKIPTGSETTLFLGFLGGYPVGAKLVGDLYRNEQVSKRTAHILLGYCSNAGPAFIFGITRFLFSNNMAPALLWLTHIISAVITAHILPKQDNDCITVSKPREKSLSAAMQSSMQTSASVCGWVITFKIIESYLIKWRNDQTSSMLMYILQGLLELSNGCIALQTLNSEPLRYILVSGFLAFGGICVLLQTISVTQGLGLGFYIPGKIIQAGISLIISAIMLIHKLSFNTLFAIVVPSILSILLARAFIKKRCGNSEQYRV